jgi:hypothetical protein
LHNDWPRQKSYEATQGVKFRKQLERDWGEAFDIVRMMLVISREIGQESVKFNQTNVVPNHSRKLECLIKLHARGCQVAAEVICLMENGFADGAFARWRTLYEIYVVTAILSDGDEILSERYVDHKFIEAKKAMDIYQQNYESLGDQVPSATDVDDIEKNHKRCIEKYGDSFKSPYGWACDHLNIKKPIFLDMEKAAGQSTRRFYYKFSSHNVHADANGLSFRLGLLEQDSRILLSGMSNIGFVEPAKNLAFTLFKLNVAIMRDRWDVDTLTQFHILNKLGGSVGSAFEAAQGQIKERQIQSLN